MAIQTGALVVYKGRPARVQAGAAHKWEIREADGQTRKVRDKDVQLLHPGPVGSLAALDLVVDPAEACELLREEAVPFAEFVDLLCGEDSPAAAWCAWQQVEEGLYFHEQAGLIQARPAEAVTATLAARQAKAAEAERRAGFLERLRADRYEDGDHDFMEQIVRLAEGRSERCVWLQELGMSQEPAVAHELLLRLGYWTPLQAPYAARFGIDPAICTLPIPVLPEEERLDLRHLASWAIDDDGNEDPDDAIAIDGDWLWVHIADVAALVTPDGDLDRQARERGASVYLPDSQTPMLPEAVTRLLGMGLAETSPALSIGVRLVAETIAEVRITPSLVRVRRLSYAAAEALVDGELAGLREVLAAFARARRARAVACMDLPENRIRVVDGRVEIRPLDRFRSRELVMDAMLAAGQAVGLWAQERALPIPFTQQPRPIQETPEPTTLAQSFARLKTLQPSRVSCAPGLHAGLGLEPYCRATSPLRRYSDLLLHQQIRAALAGREPIPAEELARRIAVGEEGGKRIRKCERLANQHYTLVYLQNLPTPWEGTGVVVEHDGRQATVMLPELALQRPLRCDSLPLDTVLRVRITHADLPRLALRFKKLA